MVSIEQQKLRRYLERIGPVDRAEAFAEDPIARDMVPLTVTSERQRDRGTAALRKLAVNEPLTANEMNVVEAIIIPDKRPVIDIVDGDFTVAGQLFTNFSTDSAIKERLLNAIPAVGRVDFPGHPTLPYGGTGFLVGDGLLMTNRHVAEIFCSGLGLKQLVFRSDFKVGVDFKRERNRPASQFFQIRNVVMIHPFWDMALLAVEGIDGGLHRPLRLSLVNPDDRNGAEVAVIGYPAFDPRNDADVQNRVFGGVYYVKRLQPGLLNERARIVSFGNFVDAATHDSSTLGGNSGSAVIDVGTGSVIALHFAGRYLEANYAVPGSELARDARVVDAGVLFAGDPEPSDTPWDGRWLEADGAEPEEEPGLQTDAKGLAPAISTCQDGVLIYRVPIEITVRIGTSPVQAPDVPSAAVEKMVEPIHETDYCNRRGYDPRFLGLDIPVPEVVDLDVVSKMDNGDHVVPYHHFSLVMHKDRRLALWTAANADARPHKKQPEPDRDYSRDGLGGLRKKKDIEKWFTDPRVPEQHQLPNRFFDKDRKAFDKGHLVRREDVAWGATYDDVRFANGDTFHATNCSPQVAGFNRSNLHGLWGELENLVLEQAEDEKLCVLAGPVLAADDPLFTGVDDDGAIRVRIPRRYWKIAIARKGGALQAFAFDLRQDLSGVDFEFMVDQVWRERMVSIDRLQQDLGLVRFAQVLHDADQSGTPDGEALRGRTGLEFIQ